MAIARPSDRSSRHSLVPQHHSLRPAGVLARGRGRGSQAMDQPQVVGQAVCDFVPAAPRETFIWRRGLRRGCDGVVPIAAVGLAKETLAIVFRCLMSDRGQEPN
jgi:hypothetical protein